jgi:hypothetical protein
MARDLPRRGPTTPRPATPQLAAAPRATEPAASRTALAGLVTWVGRRRARCENTVVILRRYSPSHAGTVIGQKPY